MRALVEIMPIHEPPEVAPFPLKHIVTLQSFLEISRPTLQENTSNLDSRRGTIAPEKTPQPPAHNVQLFATSDNAQLAAESGFSIPERTPAPMQHLIPLHPAVAFSEFIPEMSSTNLPEIAVDLTLDGGQSDYTSVVKPEQIIGSQISENEESKNSSEKREMNLDYDSTSVGRTLAATDVLDVPYLHMEARNVLAIIQLIKAAKSYTEVFKGLAVEMEMIMLIVYFNHQAWDNNQMWQFLRKLNKTSRKIERFLVQQRGEEDPSLPLRTSNMEKINEFRHDFNDLKDQFIIQANETLRQIEEDDSPSLSRSHQSEHGKEVEVEREKEEDSLVIVYKSHLLARKQRLAKANLASERQPLEEVTVQLEKDNAFTG
ncbi:hypothetical protein CPB83DRAFT_887553 [Crepidotus variabilis]|uniref:Uncharacterized protein n=1 Tax=Crepidotus variabilis TaxID=179855 RepID=A0A9P6E4K4_9AGAR|nr:hypothetical protein CPB83DRAFT_887553 [Crepidotus variabilis]